MHHNEEDIIWCIHTDESRIFSGDSAGKLIVHDFWNYTPKNEPGETIVKTNLGTSVVQFERAYKYRDEEDENEDEEKGEEEKVDEPAEEVDEPAEKKLKSSP